MYFVLTREEDDYKNLFGGAWGYYWDLESAIDAVHRNATDMHETIYPYAIIERVDQGLFPAPKERWWFGWQEEKWGFYEIDAPECAAKYPDDFSMALGEFGDANSHYGESLPADIDKNCPNYFIIAMDSKNEQYRQCGFFQGCDLAFKAVCESRVAIHNGVFDALLIECVSPRVLPASLERTWFRWNGDESRYCETEAPEEYRCYYPPHDYSVVFL